MNGICTRNDLIEQQSGKLQRSALRSDEGKFSIDMPVKGIVLHDDLPFIGVTFY